MRTFIFAALFLMLASCQVVSIAVEMPWSDERVKVCNEFVEYIKALARSDFQTTLTYEDQMLWPSLDNAQYLKLRSLHPGFSSMLARSKVVFNECTKQNEWGIYGRTYANAWMFTFRIEPPAELTFEEKVFADIVRGRQFVSVGVTIDKTWKFLPVLGPEILEVHMATKAYENYLSVIEKGQFEKIYDFTPNMMRLGLTPSIVKDEWVKSATQLPQLIRLGKPRPVTGRIVFNPNFAGANYPWGVYMDVLMDVDKTKEIKEPNPQAQQVIADYKTGINSVLMVFEDGWKPVTINPLFGSPGQDK